MTKQSNFILIPDLQIFETAHLAREGGSREHSTLKLFTKAWTYYIDIREKIISISKNSDDYLIDKKYKSAKEKRQALFSVIDVKENFDCDSHFSQIRLASKLSIEEDKDIFYVTDNLQVTELLKDRAFKVINSAQAVEMIENLLK